MGGKVAQTEDGRSQKTSFIASSWATAVCPVCIQRIALRLKEGSVYPGLVRSSKMGMAPLRWRELHCRIQTHTRVVPLLGLELSHIGAAKCGSQLEGRQIWSEFGSRSESRQQALPAMSHDEPRGLDDWT